MKGLLLLFFLSVSTIGFSQLDDYMKKYLKDTVEARRFWNDNIRNIIELDREKILEQTNFPLIIQDNRIEKEQFKLELERYFTEKIRSELKKASLRRLTSWYLLDDSTPTYILPCCEIDDKRTYSMMTLMFFQYGGQWKLKEIVFN